VCDLKAEKVHVPLAKVFGTKSATEEAKDERTERNKKVEKEDDLIEIECKLSKPPLRCSAQFETVRSITVQARFKSDNRIV
jgi:hypothetical protein